MRIWIFSKEARIKRAKIKLAGLRARRATLVRMLAGATEIPLSYIDEIVSLDENIARLDVLVGDQK